LTKLADEAKRVLSRPNYERTGHSVSAELAMLDFCPFDLVPGACAGACLGFQRLDPAPDRVELVQ
jgi:hypothetical protein